MPELPEVETLRQALASAICGKTFAHAEVRYPPLIRQPTAMEFVKWLPGQQVEEVARRGKYLLLHLTSLTLIIHLRMEGKLWLGWTDRVQEKHVHAVFTFSDGSLLLYQDVRKFGTMDLVPRGRLDLVPGLYSLGPEPLDPHFTPAVLAEQLYKHARSMIKPALLNQQVVAGLGNIYTDEALFLAKIHPERRVETLRPSHIRALHGAIRDVLERGLEAGGASVRSYRHSNGEEGAFQRQLYVYARQGLPCKRCQRPIRRIVVAGRGTHLCPHCQRQRKKV
ncbi:MAG: DNA-formamidopyrimidine glycosylase [Bacillus thermozeamaize]|uniref:Formamidopyrimidine-DNA glycosylase n=1 Tax=Bacillus thermozeamaize TaxID=230954 RepID=A0A1Y3PHD7_9BACI|nr:MAG: DNA-formamidopyrimidine glycosylase [Bacillus thermozeamaize]